MKSLRTPALDRARILALRRAQIVAMVNGCKPMGEILQFVADTIDELGRAKGPPLPPDAEHKAIVEAMVTARRLTFGDLGLTREWLLSNSAPADQLDSTAGVYVLFHRGVIVYAGQSEQVVARLRDHRAGRGRAERISFDRFAVVPCDVDKLDAVESLLIHVFQPPHNGRRRGKAGGICAPIGLRDLLLLQPSQLAHRIPRRRVNS